MPCFRSRIKGVRQKCVQLYTEISTIAASHRPSLWDKSLGMALTVNNLSVERGGRPILRDVSLTLQAGEVMQLRGPNGSGKSTLIRALCGFLRCEGEVVLNGTPLSDHDAWQDQIAYAGHLDAIKPQLTVAENLSFWAALYGGSVDHAADIFRLHEIWDRPAFVCSAGQKRRLGLARLLVADRPLWLLDEPTVSLDTDMTATVAGVIADHCANGGMVLAATHIDLGIAEAKRLDLQPVPTDTPSNDPFLAEDWA